MTSVHDETASTLALARNILSCVDPQQEFTSVRTASLVMLLEALIDLGAPRGNLKAVDNAAKTVAQQFAVITTEVEHGRR